MAKRHIPLADETRPRVNPSSSGCECKKPEHADKDAALKAILNWHMRNRPQGSFEPYQCPTSSKWHVRAGSRKS